MEKDIILILNASEGILQIVVGKNSKDSACPTLLCHQEWECPKNGTERLAPLIKDIFIKLDLPLQAIYRIACLTGAGSFTGIRLCLATSSALSRTLKAEQVSIDYLESLAYNAPIKANNTIRVLTHAKRNLVHCADFICNNDLILEQITPTKLINPEIALCEEGFSAMLGSGVHKYKESLLQSELKDKVQNNVCLKADSNHLNPHILLLLAQRAKSNTKDLMPEYVRSCDAVDNLEHISQKLGNDTEESFALYNKLVEDNSLHTI